MSAPPRTHLMRLGGAILASGATLVCAGGTASAAPSSGVTGNSGNSGSKRGADDPDGHQGQGRGGHHQPGERTQRGDHKGQRCQGTRLRPVDYLLVLTSTWIAGDADRVTTTAIPALTNGSTQAQAHENAGNRAVLQPLINDLNSQISTATNATRDLTTNVLAVTPAQWDGNHRVLAPSKSSDQTAGAAIQKGRADVRQIVQDLRGSGLRGRLGSTSTTT